MGKKEVFGTAVNCMDGRVQDPVSRWMRSHLSVDYVDTITEPGVDKALVEGTPANIESIRSELVISARAHGSRVVAVVGHHDCAGNPVDRERHLAYIRASAEVIQTWKLGLRVIGLWVDEDWRVEKILDTGEG